MGTPCDSQRARFSQRVTVLPCTLGRTTTRWRHPRQAITPARRPSCGPRTLAAQGRQHSVSTASAVSAQRQHSVSTTSADHPPRGRTTAGWSRPRQAITRAPRPSCGRSTRAAHGPLTTPNPWSHISILVILVIIKDKLTDFWGN